MLSIIGFPTFAPFTTIFAILFVGAVVVVVVLVVVLPLTLPIPKLASIEAVLRFTNCSILRLTGVPVVPTIAPETRTLNDPRSIAQVGSVIGSLLKRTMSDIRLADPTPRNASRRVICHKVFVSDDISNPLNSVMLLVGFVIRTFSYIPSGRRF